MRALAIVLVALALVLVGCSDEQKVAPSTPTVEGSPTLPPMLGLTATPFPSPRPRGIPEPTIPPATDAPLLELPPVPDVPRPTVKVTFAPPLPGRTFDPAPKDNTALYDIERGLTIDLGPGGTGAFSPDSRHMTWATWGPNQPARAVADQVWVIDVYTLEKRYLGEGTRPRFWNNNTVMVQVPHPTRPRERTPMLVDIETGSREPKGERKDSVPVPELLHRARLTNAEISSDRRDEGMLVVRETSGLKPLLRLPLEVLSAHPLDADTLLIQVGGTPTTEPGPTPWKNFHVYLVTVSTQEVTFITTKRPCEELAGNEDYVAWTESTSTSGSKLFLYDRRTAAVLEINESFWPVFLSNGMLGHGIVGIERLVDMNTLQYYAVLPEEPFFTSWSPDLKFASAGYTPAHGAGC